MTICSNTWHWYGGTNPFWLRKGSFRLRKGLLGKERAVVSLSVCLYVSLPVGLSVSWSIFLSVCLPALISAISHQQANMQWVTIIENPTHGRHIIFQCVWIVPPIPVTCHLSCVNCHVSFITCHVSLVTCHLSHLSPVTNGNKPSNGLSPR